ncbi:MAG: TRL-like family protein [Ketobacter sp.]
MTMNRSVKALTVCSIFAALGGCASSFPVGGVLTDVTIPVAVTANDTATKTGTASCQSILSLIAQGDCSIEAAKKAGNITNVTHIDWKANNILGIIGKYELIVHGN